MKNKNNNMRKLVNGTQFLRMGDDWYATAKNDCNEKSKCMECSVRGECIFFKECHYLFLRDMD